MANKRQPRRHASWKRAALSVITVGVALAGSLAATGQANASSSQVRKTGSLVSSAMRASGQLAQVATRASAADAALSPSTYGGVSMNTSTDVVTIYVTKAPSSRMLATAAADAAAGHVRYKIVKYTMTRLLSGQTSLTDSVQKLASEGIDITDWGPDPVTNTLHVGLIHPTSAAEASVSSIAGVPVTFTAEDSYPVKTATRINDTSAYNGGDFMEDVNGGCTTGIPVVKGSSQYYLSVGHCFDYVTGDKKYNDDTLDSRGCHITGCAYLGESSHVDNNPGYDDALMSGVSYSDLDWENSTPYNPPGTLNGFTNPQQSYSTSVVGELVCPSGAYEGLVCNTKVLFVKEDANFGGGILHNIDRAQNTSAIPVGSGDSGGPVFTTPSGHLNIEGIIEARGDPIPCKTYAGRGSACSSTIYYFDFATQAAVWGVTLKTS
jgi:hypothetical protein